MQLPGVTHSLEGHISLLRVFGSTYPHPFFDNSHSGAFLAVMMMMMMMMIMVMSDFCHASHTWSGERRLHPVKSMGEWDVASYTSEEVFM